MYNNYAKQVGARLFSELNDLKRTPEIFAKEAGLHEDLVKKILNGDGTEEEIHACIQVMGKIYPIHSADLLMPRDDCQFGVKICRQSLSESTSRILNRKNRFGVDAPYYEYRDTAMSCTSYFKPEWIRELRVVDNNDPENPDVIYNNGHLLHQTTFFIGPVNFYYELNGKKHCAVMNTGDSMYISPFLKHSFASRDQNQLALILAVTFGGNVRRAQNELYLLGAERVGKLKLPMDDPKAYFVHILNQHLSNERMTVDQLHAMLTPSIDLRELLTDQQRLPTPVELQTIAQALNMDPAEFSLLPYLIEHEIVITQASPDRRYHYPSVEKSDYLIAPLARTPRLSSMKCFDVQVNANQQAASFDGTLHTYGYNYGACTIYLDWQLNGAAHRAEINPGDSFFIQPMVEHSFTVANAPGALFLVGIAGAIDWLTQKELSYLSTLDRITYEFKRWF